MVWRRPIYDRETIPPEFKIVKLWILEISLPLRGISLINDFYQIWHWKESQICSLTQSFTAAALEFWFNTKNHSKFLIFGINLLKPQF